MHVYGVLEMEGRKKRKIGKGKDERWRFEIRDGGRRDSILKEEGTCR